MPFISIAENNEKRYFKLPEGKLIVFGREEHVDFQILEDSLVSREHFGIEQDESGNFVIIDLGSSNGTFLNGRKLEPNSIRILKNGDTIKAGRMSFKFENNHPQNPTTTHTAEPIKKVIEELKKGRGFKTIMSEIINETKTKK